MIKTEVYKGFLKPQRGLSRWGGCTTTDRQLEGKPKPPNFAILSFLLTAFTNTICMKVVYFLQQGLNTNQHLYSWGLEYVAVTNPT